MADLAERFRILPTTERSAGILARRYGYASVAALADSLPPDARVLDVGAGASSLGREIARLRPDVRWTNLDFSYYDTQILDDVSKGAPSNLTFVAGDATQLDVSVSFGSMDAVFSYWLLPHLSLYDQKTALTAARQMYVAAKPGGVLAIGPRVHPMLHPASLTGRSWRITKGEGMTAEAFGCEVLRRTQLSAASRHVRKAFNAAAFELFGTSRYIKGGGAAAWRLYNPRTGAYIPLYSPEAVYLAVRLATSVAAKVILPVGSRYNQSRN